MSQATYFTRRSVLRWAKFGAAALSMQSRAPSSNFDSLQTRQCMLPSRLRGLSPPYLVRFKYFGGDEVVFLAARHSVDVNSPTHALVRHMLAALTPDRLIIEGYANDSPRLQPEDLVGFSRNRYPETRYALAIAESRGIRAVGGDLHSRDLAQASINHGFELQDVLGTHIVRALSDRLSIATVTTTEYWVRRQLGDLFPHSGFNFRDWYLLRVGEPVSRASAIRVYHGPCGSGIIARIASFQSEARNRRLLLMLQKSRREATRIGAIFGANHLYAVFDRLSDAAATVEIVVPSDLPQPSNRNTTV